MKTFLGNFSRKKIGESHQKVAKYYFPGNFSEKKRGKKFYTGNFGKKSKNINFIDAFTGKNEKKNQFFAVTYQWQIHAAAGYPTISPYTISSFVACINS